MGSAAGQHGVGVNLATRGGLDHVADVATELAQRVGEFVTDRQPPEQL